MRELDEARTSRRRAFSLVLSAQSAGILPQAIYTLELSQLGSLSVFCVPLERIASGCTLEIVFA